jgi:drug/metabolite transporter (DMT)-like permease
MRRQGSSGRGRVYVLQLALAAACWGGGTVVSKAAVAEFAPLTLLPIQLATSLVALLVVLWLRHEDLGRGREVTLLGRLGILNPGIAYALSLVGLTEITASLSVLVWAGEPILILALAVPFLGERAGAFVVAASAAAVAGLLLVILDTGASGSLLGVTLTVAGVVACAIYTVAARRWLPGTSDSTLAVIVRQQAHALALAVVVLVAIGLAGGATVPASVTPVGIASAVASGLLYYGLAYWFYLSALRSVSAPVAAASFYLIPVFGLAFASLAGERLEPLQWFGAVVVVAAVAAITVRSTARQGS